MTDENEQLKQLYILMSERIKQLNDKIELKERLLYKQIDFVQSVALWGCLFAVFTSLVISYISRF